MSFWEDVSDTLGWGSVKASDPTSWGTVYTGPFESIGNAALGPNNPYSNLFSLPTTALQGGDWQKQSASILKDPRTQQAVGAATGLPPGVISLASGAGANVLEHGTLQAPAQVSSDGSIAVDSGGVAYSGSGILPTLPGGEIDTRTILMAGGALVVGVFLIILVKK